MENKRLTNIADPVDASDAVSLAVVQSAVKQEVRLVYQVTASLRNDLDDLTVRIQHLETQFEDNANTQRLNSENFINRIESLDTVENNFMIRSLESSLKETLKRTSVDYKTSQDLTLHNTEIISQLDKRLTALENGR